MKTGPLLLSSIFFTDVRISANPQAKETDLYNVDYGIDPKPTRSVENPRQWTIMLKVKIISKEGILAPYTGEIENIGIFTVADNWPEDQVEKLVFVNASGILYSSIREMISLITSRGFFPAFTLPSCSFMEMYKEHAEAKKKEQELANQPPLDLPNPSKAN